jgi:hypothetical protein
MLRRATPVLFAAVSISGAPVPALAHTRLFETPTPIETSSVSLSAELTSTVRLDALALLVVGLALITFIDGILAIRDRRWRRMLAIMLAPMLTVTVFETAIHSVHHLGDIQAGERCLVGSSGTHTHAIDVEPPPIPGALTRVVGVALVAPAPCCLAVVLGPISSRAPPV